MSLWFESFALALYDCGDNQIERAKCILSYFSMDIPRSWWERSLITGHIDQTQISIVRGFLGELSSLGVVVSAELLIALSFAKSDLDVKNGRTTIEHRIAKAKKVLAKRPELTRLGMLIYENASKNP
jgi:hypothetical protein